MSKTLKYPTVVTRGEKLAKVGQFERSRDRYYAVRHEMLLALDEQMDACMRAALATKCPEGMAYGARDLQHRKARALSMNSWRS